MQAAMTGPLAFVSNVEECRARYQLRYI